MKVEKQTVNLDEIESVIYNGKEQAPSVMDSELFIYEFSPVRDAGEYRVIFKVKDKLNYAFINGEDSISVPFSIEKRVLKVKVTDIILYLFEKEITPSYSVLEGEIALGDNLVPSYIIGDSEISVSFENCNYDVEIIPGKIERMKSLSKETQRISLIIFFVFMTGAIALAAVIINRKRLYRYYRALLCRSSYFEGEADCMESMETLAAEISEELISKDSIDKYDGEVEKNSAIIDFCERDDEPFSSMINADYADGAITDSLARDLIRRDAETIVTDGYKKGITNVDTLSRSFSPGDRVDVNILKKKSLVPYDTAYIKVLARGVIDKPLIVYANDFSLSAVKMIALTGGCAIIVKNKGK